VRRDGCGVGKEREEKVIGLPRAYPLLKMFCCNWKGNTSGKKPPITRHGMFFLYSSSFTAVPSPV